jgi:hypothetical protein
MMMAAPTARVGAGLAVAGFKRLIAVGIVASASARLPAPGLGQLLG